MSREVRHDGASAFEIRFPFDRALVDLIKSLPNRRWNASERFWSVPEDDVVLLVELLVPQRFRFDEVTVERYEAFGGTIRIEAPAPRVEPTRRPRGLFDDDDEVDTAAESGAPASGDFTVSTLNQRVKDVIEGAFPESVWVVGEISGFNRNAHKRHVGFQLDEKSEDGATRSSVSATLFDATRREVERVLKRAGDPFRLEDEITVRMKVRVELYVPWGSYRVIVDELDVNYTLGEAARRREEIIRRLTEEGLVGVNPALPFPALPLRVGLVTSLGSDAYNDVVRTLEESGFAFLLTAHGARVQGHSTEPSVLNALDALRARSDDLDVVLICRGGGARTDLAWFDSEALGRAVATFPLPVVVGIGHEQDHSVLDAVGRRCKTPTAAAALLVDTVRESSDRVERTCNDAIFLATDALREAHRVGAERGRRLAVASRSLLERESERLDDRRARAARGSRTVVGSASERLTRWLGDLPRATSVLLGRQQGLLDSARRAIVQGARRDVHAATDRVESQARLLGPRAQRLVVRETERADARDRRLHLVNPRRVVERGYAILRLADGSVLTGADAAPAGTALDAELRGGRLRLRSEGSPDNDERGES
jgi:exodeoxyribonuclease VII large subunit